MSSRSASAVLTVLSSSLVTTTVVHAVVRGEAGEPLAQAGLAAVFIAVGAVLTWRVPGNRLSWLMAATGLAASTLAAVSAGLGHHRVLDIAVALVGSWVWLLAIGMPATLGLLWFPTGSVPGARWRWVERTAIAAMATVVVTAMVVPFEVSGVASFPNPFAPAGAEPVLTLAFEAAAATVAILGPVCAASLIVRFRRADHLQRAQLRWLAWSGGLGTTAYLLGDFLTRLPFITHPLLAYGGLTLVGVSIAVAVTRYRLFDIDRLVSRTVGYAVVTSLLVAIYAALVVGAQTALGPADAPDVVVAGATLVVAALFGPLRRRVQRSVDRHFDRRAYDAELTLTTFGHLLRDELDLEQLGDHLRGTVREAVQPATVSLWLVPPDANREGVGGKALQ